MADSAELGLADLTLLRAELGLGAEVHAVNAGSNGPLCGAAREAIIAGYQATAQSGGQASEGFMEGYERDGGRDRAALAALLGCDSDDIALCESTTAGLNILLWGAQLAPGDEIITTSLENPALLIPLKLLAARRGCRLRMLGLGTGEIDVADAFELAASPRTRMVVVSDVNFATGARLNVRGLAEAARRRDVLCFIDGVQAAGTVPIDVVEAGVDGYAIARHKFLCGPAGAGAVYVSPAALERVRPVFAGVFSDAAHGAGADVVLPCNARRFEVSTRALPVTAGAAAALEWLAGIGYAKIHAATASNGAALHDGLQGLPRVRIRSPQRDSALLAFELAGKDPDRIVAGLAAAGIGARSVRIDATLPSSAAGNSAVRLASGFWTRPGDIDHIVTTIAALAAGSGSG